MNRNNGRFFIPLALACALLVPAAAGAVALADEDDFLTRLGVTDVIRLDLALPSDPSVAEPRAPLPEVGEGIGPGSRLHINLPGGGLGACTANFVWADATGKLYLGAAGHCFLPEDKKATHGDGADFPDYGSVGVSACWRGCQFGGQSGFVVRGQYANLGEVVYARQASASGTQVGYDFGLVEIPESLYHLVRTQNPMWGGPTGTADVGFGDRLLVYGNGVVWGEFWATKGRAGVGIGSDERAWFGDVPSAFGDSGAAVSKGYVTPNTDVIGHVKAVGLITHLGVGPAVTFGTTMEGAATLAEEDAGLVITPVLSDADLPS